MDKETDSPAITETKKIDYFRDTPLRLLGYANEVGEAFRQLVPVSVVRFSYVVASTYCFGDALSKGLESRAAHQQQQQHSEQLKHPEKSVERVAIETFVEAAVWQGLASVIIPGFTINRICWLSGKLLGRGLSHVLSVDKQRYLVTGIGMGSIPFIIKPIDTLVDHVVEKAVRDYNNASNDE